MDFMSPSSLGMLPVSWFWSKRRTRIFSSFPNSLGMPPVRWFRPSSSWSNCPSRPHSGGISPLKLLSSNWMASSMDSSLNSAGSAPWQNTLEDCRVENMIVKRETQGQPKYLRHDCCTDKDPPHLQVDSSIARDAPASSSGRTLWELNPSACSLRCSTNATLSATLTVAEPRPRAGWRTAQEPLKTSWDPVPLGSRRRVGCDPDTTLASASSVQAA